MSSGLSRENEQFLDHVVSLGIFHDRAEALDKAVELLRRRQQLIRDVDEGIEQLERGEGTALDIEAVKADVRQRCQGG